jgi:signal transduction histidine kinase
MHIPIRLKILASAMLLLMLTVAVITAVMADLFHADKTTYIKDLAAVTATSAQSEVDTLLASYESTLRAFGDLISATYLEPQQKEKVSASLFTANRALVAVTALAPDGSPVTLYDRNALAALAITPKDITTPLPVGNTAVTNGTASNIALIELRTYGRGQTIRVTLAPPYRLIGELRADGLIAALARVRSFGTTLVDEQGRVLLENQAAAAMPAATAGNVTEGKSAVVAETVIGDAGYFVATTRSAIAPVGLVVTVPRSATYLTARSVLTRLTWIGIALVIVATALTMMIARRLSRPIEQLSRAADTVGQGNFDVQVDVSTHDEVAQLARSFNTMAGNLRERDARLRETNVQLVQSEKMAAVGQLSAGLAHEVKNPLAGILGFAQLTRRSLDNPEKISKNLDVIERETRRCTDIISNLMHFSRQEPGERLATNINDAVALAIGLVDHQLGLQRIRIEKELGSYLPFVFSNANQLQQVVMNLLINAQQAMAPAGGTVKIRTRTAGDKVLIEVEDSGPGVPAELRSRIFEPFYTTKRAGQGTGLGLSVSYGIVRDHGGSISVDDAPGGGARFTIALPARPDLGPGDQMRSPTESQVA